MGSFASASERASRAGGHWMLGRDRAAEARQLTNRWRRGRPPCQWRLSGRFRGEPDHLDLADDRLCGPVPHSSPSPIPRCL